MTADQIGNFGLNALLQYYRTEKVFTKIKYITYNRVE
jgi:hypothetical protein